MLRIQRISFQLLKQDLASKAALRFLTRYCFWYLKQNCCCRKLLTLILTLMKCRDIRGSSPISSRCYEEKVYGPSPLNLTTRSVANSDCRDLYDICRIGTYVTMYGYAERISHCESRLRICNLSWILNFCGIKNEIDWKNDKRLFRTWWRSTPCYLLRAVHAHLKLQFTGSECTGQNV